MPSLENPFAFRAVSLLYPESKASPSNQSSEAFILELRQNASSVDPQTARNAIEVLVNLVVSPDDPGEIAKLALQALMSIAGDSKAKPYVRAAIQEMAFDVFEITAGKGFARAADSKKELGGASAMSGSSRKHELFSLSPELLVLALRHAQICKYEATQSAIGDALDAAFEIDRSGWGQMKLPDRFSTSTELFGALETLHDQRLPVEPDILVPAFGQFNDSFLDISRRALGSKRPEAVLVLHQNHFVAVVVGPSQSGKMDVVVYDSLHGKDHVYAKYIAKGIQDALKDQLQKLTYAGGNVQGTTNGCGALCVRALSEVRASGARSMEKVAQLLEADIATLAKFDDLARADLIAGWRARMLGGVLHNDDLLEAFKQQMKPDKPRANSKAPGLTKTNEPAREEGASIERGPWQSACEHHGS